MTPQKSHEYLKNVNLCHHFFFFFFFLESLLYILVKIRFNVNISQENGIFIIFKMFVNYDN